MRKIFYCAIFISTFFISVWLLPSIGFWLNTVSAIVATITSKILFKDISIFEISFFLVLTTCLAPAFILFIIGGSNLIEVWKNLQKNTDIISTLIFISPSFFGLCAFLLIEKFYKSN
jgi:hypothetical protein